MHRATRLIPVLLILVFAGCATGPRITSRRAPEWVLSPPESTVQHEVFVVSASSERDLTEAEEAAGYALLARINQALGVDITVRTSAQARASLDSYEADLVQQVTQSGSGRITGLRITDRFLSRQGDLYVVYVLGEYERGAFETEQRRREALLRQEEELLSAPEAAGDQFARSGVLTQAIAEYTQAATAAAGSELEIAPVVLERSLQKAADTAGRLFLAAASGPSSAWPGEAPADPVVFRLTNDSGHPVAGAALEISYTERRGDRDSVRTVSMATNNDGEVAFFHPAPARVGDFTVHARLESQPILSLLDQLPSAVEAQAESIAAAIVNIQARYQFAALSRARTIPTAIAMVDLDLAGAFMDGGLAGAGMTEALSQSGFVLRTTHLDPSTIVALSSGGDPAVLSGSIPASITRLIYGTAQIAETREEDGVFVKVRGTATAMDLDTGAILQVVSGIKNARSRTADRAIATALAELGRQLGDELAATLP